jgi:hypothetical protein
MISGDNDDLSRRVGQAPRHEYCEAGGLSNEQSFVRGTPSLYAQLKPSVIA